MVRTKRPDKETQGKEIKESIKRTDNKNRQRTVGNICIKVNRRALARPALEVWIEFELTNIATSVKAHKVQTNLFCNSKV